MVKNTVLIDRLMAWYADQCDGDWEHSYGNPAHEPALTAITGGQSVS